MNSDELIDMYRHMSAKDTMNLAMAIHNPSTNSSPFYQRSNMTFASTNQRSNVRGQGQNVTVNYWNGYACIDEKYVRDDTTMTLPKYVPMEEMEPLIRKTFFERTCNTIKDASRPDWQWKTAALQDRFQRAFPGLNKDALRSITDFKSFTSTWWGYSGGTTYDDSFTRLPSGQDGGDYTEEERKRLRWISWTVTVDPSKINDGDLDPQQMPSPFNCEVWLRFPMDNNGRVIPSITKQMVTDATNTAGAKLLLLAFPQQHKIFHRKAKLNYSQPTQEAMDAWMRERKAQIQFYVMRQKAAKLYLAGLQAETDLKTRLENCKMKTVVNNKIKILRVHDLENQFRQIISDAPNDPTEALKQTPELDEVFLRNTIDDYRNNEDLQKLLRDGNGNTLPASTGWNERMGRFNKMTRAVKEAERKVLSTYKQIQVAVGDTRRVRPTLSGNAGVTLYTSSPTHAATYNPSPITMSTFGQPGSPESFIHPDRRSAFAHTVDNSTNTSPSDQGGSVFAGIADVQGIMEHYAAMTPEQLQANAVAAHCYLSNAEQALRDASGLKAPVQCWGCGGDHLFSNCPRKMEPEVRENFLKGLAKFREQNRYRADASKWKANGYPSKKVYTVLTEIADPATPKERRIALLGQLDDVVKSKRKKGGGESSGTHVSFADDDDEDEKPQTKQQRVTFISYFGNIAREDIQEDEGDKPVTFQFAAEQDEGPIVYNMASSMAHLVVPVGKKDHGYVIEGLFDTGGCSNLGDLDYFLEICKQYPDLVCQVKTLKEARREDINIGGIGKTSTSAVSADPSASRMSLSSTCRMLSVDAKPPSLSDSPRIARSHACGDFHSSRVSRQ